MKAYEVAAKQYASGYRSVDDQTHAIEDFISGWNCTSKDIIEFAVQYTESKYSFVDERHCGTKELLAGWIERMRWAGDIRCPATSSLTVQCVLGSGHGRAHKALGVEWLDGGPK